MRDIFDLSDRATEQLAALDPTIATYQGIAGHEHRWPDYSPAGAAASLQAHVDLLEQAKSCVTADARQVLAQRVLVEYCESMIRYYESHGHHVALNTIDSAHQDLRFIYGSMAGDTLDDWGAIVTRTSNVGEALAGFRETLEEGRLAGNVVSRRQILAIIEQGAVASGDDSTFNELRTRLADSPVADATIEESLEEAITLARRAFADFNDYLESVYLPASAPQDAVGEERYMDAAEMFLGTRLDARSTYRWGWDEVERLWQEMQAACARIDPDAPATEVLDRLNTDPKYAAAGPDEFIALMRERQEHALRSLEGVHFDVPEHVREIDVQVAPEGGALGAHYVGPSEDFSRRGSVWYSIEGQQHFPLFTEVTTAYHEGFPGHHLQVGVQMSLGDRLSRFHRSFVWYPGSGEGWALYAEHLMGELGYLEEPQYVIGLLSSQLLRAARVAIDIGVHIELPIPDDVTFNPGKSWTFELAHELLTDRAFLPDDIATSEVLRYFGWPGQAIAYKVGERQILELREEWLAAGHSDLKEFHSTVLSCGSVGLDLLRDQVRSAMCEVG